MAGFGLIGYRKPAKLLIQSLSTFWIRAGICATRPIRCPSLNTLSLRSAQGRGLALEAVTAGHKWFEEQRGPTRTVCLIKAQNEVPCDWGRKSVSPVWRLRLQARSPYHLGAAMILQTI